MLLSPKGVRFFGGLEPPPYTFSSPTNSVFSISSEEGESTRSESSYDLQSSQVYDAQEISNSPTRNPDLPKPSSDPPVSPDNASQHSGTSRNPNLKVFTDHTCHFYSLFQLSADRFKPFSSCSVEEILRASAWWFIQGSIHWRSWIKNDSHENDRNISFESTQTDIAKSLWLLQEAINRETLVVLNNGAKPRSQYLKLMLGKIDKIVQSMREQGFFSIHNTDSVFSPSTDCSIWVDYPSLGVDMGYLLTGHVTQRSENGTMDGQLLHWMPLGPSEDMFYFKALSVDVYIFSKSSNSRQVKYPSILSIVRERKDSQISVILASQDGQLKFRLKPEKDLKSAWDNTNWLTNINSLEIRLPTGFRLHVRFTEADFKILYDMYQHHNKANTLFERGLDEKLIFQANLDSVECRRAVILQTESEVASNCKLRLFQKIITRAAGTGPRQMYRGSRLAILTPTTSKHISVLEYSMQPDQIVEFYHLREHDGKPAVSLKMNNCNSETEVVLVFSEKEQFNVFLSHLTGCHLAEGENIFANVQLKAFSIAVGLKIHGQAELLGSYPWQRVWVINCKPWHDAENEVEISTTVLSESLRIVVESSNSRLVDRLNLGIGELRIRRNVLASGHELHILREAQKDLTYSTSTFRKSTERQNEMMKILRDIQTQPSIRSFSFPTIFELHQFQAAITGFSVLYDGTPASFSISRRRLLVPTSKERESLNTRVQILRRKESFQLVAFFEGFKHGKCMNFALRPTDKFQMIKSGSRILLRLVDAKFSLPSTGDNFDGGIEWGFVNLDSLEYPDENNNITIGFESHVDYSKFTQALPAQVKT